jgi:hypothetical protein
MALFAVFLIKRKIPFRIYTASDESRRFGANK